MGFFDGIWGPSDSGSQHEDSDSKSGGSGKTNDDGSIHYSDWSDNGSHASWDESGSDISGQHSTDSDGNVTDNSK